MADERREALDYAGPATPPPPDPFDASDPDASAGDGRVGLPCLLVLPVPLVFVIGLIGGAAWTMRGLVMD